MADIDAIRAYHDELTAIRRDFHAHPELGFEEQRTSDIVAQKLAEWGIEVHRNIGGTAVEGRAAPILPDPAHPALWRDRSVAADRGRGARPLADQPMVARLRR